MRRRSPASTGGAETDRPFWLFPSIDHLLCGGGAECFPMEGDENAGDEYDDDDADDALILPACKELASLPGRVVRCRQPSTLSSHYYYYYYLEAAAATATAPSGSSVVTSATTASSSSHAESSSAASFCSAAASEYDYSSRVSHHSLAASSVFSTRSKDGSSSLDLDDQSHFVSEGCSEHDDDDDDDDESESSKSDSERSDDDDDSRPTVLHHCTYPQNPSKTRRDTTTTATTTATIKNFRRVAGTSCLFRSGKLDALAWVVANNGRADKQSNAFCSGEHHTRRHQHTGNRQRSRPSHNNVYESKRRTSSNSSSSNAYEMTMMDAAEHLLLYQAGLVIDLRSASERHEHISQQWMSQAPGGPFTMVHHSLENLEQALASSAASPNSTTSTAMSAVSKSSSLASSLRKPQQQQQQQRQASVGPTTTRIVLCLDPLAPTDLTNYIDRKWFPSLLKKIQLQRLKLSARRGRDPTKLNAMRLQALNQRGLFGLYQAILECAPTEFRVALQAMVIYLERFPGRPVVIHCVHGKDRTGLLVMLCQSMVGLSRKQIIRDYHRSETETVESPAAEQPSRHHHHQPLSSLSPSRNMDQHQFRMAPRQVMVQTLDWIDQTYGSVRGYLEWIGLDAAWQQRFCAAVTRPTTRTTTTTTTIVRTPKSITTTPAATKRRVIAARDQASLPSHRKKGR